MHSLFTVSILTALLTCFLITSSQVISFPNNISSSDILAISDLRRCPNANGSSNAWGTLSMSLTDCTVQPCKLQVGKNYTLSLHFENKRGSNFLVYRSFLLNGESNATVFHREYDCQCQPGYYYTAQASFVVFAPVELELAQGSTYTMQGELFSRYFGACSGDECLEREICWAFDIVID